MRQSRIASSVVVLGGIACAACGAEPIPFTPVSDVKLLMQRVVDPAADAVWDSVGTIITIDGIEEIAPQTDEEWTAVRYGAAVLMESGNLLMLGDRARDNEAWMRLSADLAEAGAAALAAAEARDPEAVFAVGEQVYFACDRCHNLYWVGDETRRPMLDLVEPDEF